MKTLNLFTVLRSILVMVMVTSLLLITACKEDEPAPVKGTVEADVPDFAVVNSPVTFLDKSNNAASRAWTFQDGTPATSIDRSVDVTFSSEGTKTITLDVVFDNGTTNSETYTVEVAAELGVSFTSTETVNFNMGDNDIEVSVSFQSTVVGNPDSYSWSFPGGTPETSTEANPTVVWTGGGMPEVSLTVSRTADGASLEAKEMVQVGPANLLSADIWGFEAPEVTPNFQTWNGGINEPWPAGVFTQVNTAYDGNGAVEINWDGNDAPYYGVISRDTKAANATEGALKLGDIVLFSYYVKASVDGAVITYGRIDNLAPSWWEGGPPAGWEGFTAADAQSFQDWCWTQPTCTMDWQRISVIDTLDNLSYAEALNVYPEFGFEGQEAALFSLDKVELKLLGNIND